VGSGLHHAAPYIRHSWRMNQGLSVNNILLEGPDLLDAEVVGCPTTSVSSRMASTSSPTVHRRRLLIKFTYKPYGISLFLSKTEHRRKIYHQSPKLNPTSANPSRSSQPKIQQRKIFLWVTGFTPQFLKIYLIGLLCIS
jgi:hypothetical protein